jgi:pimeloyl-ACP methyl ester carboxylesterase
VTDLHVDVHDGRGPPLLMAHGFLSSRAQWTPNLEALRQVSTPVVVELLGHGRSPSPGDPAAYAVEAYVAAFETLRERLGAARWFVLGQSFGAGLTIRYALTHPDRVIGQVFTNSISGLSPPPMDDPAIRLARAQAVRSGGRAALQAMPFYPRPTKRWPPAIFQALVDDAALLSPNGIAGTIAHTVQGLSVLEELTRISVPTLLVNGVREAAFQPMRDHAVAQIAGLEVVDLDGGHSINLDQPAAFNAAVSAFIAEHAST